MNQKTPFNLQTWDFQNDRWKLQRSYSKPLRLCAVKFCRNLKSSLRGVICEKCKSREWRANHPRQYAYANLKSSARRRKIPFNLTKEEFNSVIEGTQYLELRGITARKLHVDRINPALGYEINNLQIISASENCAKDNNRWREEDPF